MEYNNYYYMYSNRELYHHGVKGMKWGVRRYQKKDGSLTPAGKKRYDSPEDLAARRERNKKIAKRVAVASVMTATVAAAAVLYAKNPKAVNDFVAKASKATVSSLKTGGSKAVNAGKKYMDRAITGAKKLPKKTLDLAKKSTKEALNSAKQGVKEGLQEAPKKAAKSVVTGMALMGTKRLLDKTVGKEESARIFQANNNKKISSFWKVSGEDREDDDD